MLRLAENAVLALCKSYAASEENLAKEYDRLDHSSKLSARELFSSRLRASNQRILLLQLCLLRMSSEIIRDLINKVSLSEALSRQRNHENDKLFRNTEGPIFYRKKLVEYFRTFPKTT